MDQVKPYDLWVGHAGDGRAFPGLLDKGIRAVVQLAIEEPPLKPPRELVYCRFPLLDGDDNDADVLWLAIRSLAALIRRGIPTKVPNAWGKHCRDATSTGEDACGTRVACPRRHRRGHGTRGTCSPDACAS